MGERLKEFRKFRQAMNKRILDEGDLQINRFFTLDGKAYEDGELEKNEE